MIPEVYILLILIAGAVLTALYALVAKWIGVRHKWDYQNPFHRTCKCCGRVEIEHLHQFEEKNWWMVEAEGELWRHKDWADKFILRDLFWPQVLQNQATRFLKEEEENEHRKNS